MKKIKQASIFLLVTIILLTGFNSQVLAEVSDTRLNDAIEDTAMYMYKTVSNPQVGSIGGEWAVLGLARSGHQVPDEYYKKYYAVVEDYVKTLDGKLHRVKYTEYSRLIVALTAIGKDPRDVGGYNLLTPLGDYDKTIFQGLNGPIWALIALDSGSYPMPQNSEAKTQATRDMYIQRILDCQLIDGGWSLFGGTPQEAAGNEVSDPDITGMALQALAKYQDRPEVKKATEEALEIMSKQQNERAGFFSWGSENSESCVQIIVALTELGIPLDDPRFVKNGKTPLDNLMTYYIEGNGFLHTANGSGSNQMASEQGFYGLVAAKRYRDGRNSLYRMGDAIQIKGKIDGLTPGLGLPNKNEFVKASKIKYPDKTFKDITGLNAHKNQKAIETLASREIIKGKALDKFDPDGYMTRSEFATIIVKSLGLNPATNNNFEDVKEDAWYSGYVETANRYNIVKGTGEGKIFNPEGTITKEEAVTMIARAAKLSGMDIELDVATTRDILAQFVDYVEASDWAMSSLAFAYGENILDESDIEINPKSNVTRAEVAQMIFNMLGKVNLL